MFSLTSTLDLLEQQEFPQESERLSIREPKPVNMKQALSTVLALATASLAAPSSVVRQGKIQPLALASRGLNSSSSSSSSSSTAGTKIILDNDWSTAGFIPYLMALNAGWDVLGLIGDTSNSWALQTSLHGLATLEVGNLSSCIPVYKGSDYPLIMTPELFQTWEDLHGDLAWVCCPWPSLFALETW